MTNVADRKRRARRLRQIAFISFVLALLVAAWFIRGAFSLRTLLGLDSPEDAIALYALSTLNFIALVTLALVLVRHLVKLARERREGRLGSQFKTRMVMGSIALSLLPTAMLFLFSFFLIDTSLRIFVQPSQGIAENARAILETYVNEEVGDLRSYARLVVQRDNLKSDPLADASALDNAAKQLQKEAKNLQLAAVELREAKAPIVQVSGNEKDAELEPIFREKVAEARREVDAGRVYQGQARNTDDDGAVFMIVGVPVGARSLRPRGFIVVRRFSPELAARFDEIDDLQRDSEQLVREQAGVRTRYVATLSLVTLIVLFAAIWIALFVSRTVTEPIQALVEATDEVASGNLAHRIDVVADGELATLVGSFNAMAAQLGESRRRLIEAAVELESGNARLEERRAYIETVLASLSTGVVSVDAENRVTTVNAAAARMLGLGPGPYDLEELGAAVGPARAKIETLIRRARRAGSAASDMELRLLDGTTLPVSVSASALHGPEGEFSGAVVTVEDLSELIKAERSAAWNEVARRMAHEIKNPLTPIRLSADRLMRGLKRDEALAGTRYAAIVEECSATIVREVGAMQHMVEEFASYARMPRARVEAADLNELVRASLGLYPPDASDADIVAVLATALPPVVVDPEQIRRVIVNLVDNAIEAVAGAETRQVRVSTRYDAARDVAVVEVSDTGHGLDPESRDSLFLPYFSTRKKGTGLGLAIVSHIVADHGGRVWAEPNSPAGARFVVELPATPRGAEPRESPELARTRADS